MNNLSLGQQENLLGNTMVEGSLLTNPKEDKQKKSQVSIVVSLRHNPDNDTPTRGQEPSEKDNKRNYSKLVKREWRRKRRRKNSDEGDDKLSDKQIKHNGDQAINEKKCRNNRKVLNSIWINKIDANNKFKELLLLDINLGDDISTMTNIFGLISVISSRLKTKRPSIIDDQEGFLRNKVAFFYVYLNPEYFTHINNMTTRLDFDYKNYYETNYRRRAFPKIFDSTNLFGGFRNYTAWKYLNAQD
jgi:hypothetical protein